MKFSLLKVSGIALLATGLISGQAFAAATMATSKHNLSSTGQTVAQNQNAGTTEICVFCHTPHGSTTTAPVPLWNRGMGAGPYTTYAAMNSSTLEGTVEAVGGISLACLSCHDGTIAINTLNNAPGATSNGDTTWQTGYQTWTGSTLDASSKIQGAAKIGADLKDDHPVGVQYGGGPAGAVATIPTTGGAGVYTASLMKDKGFVAAAADTASGWWVDVAANGTSGVRDKTDMVLFTRNVGGNQPYVECATCHDPHSNATLFLRTDNTGSALCIACHTK